MHTKNYNIITTVGSSVSVDGIWIYIYTSTRILEINKFVN